ncbi:MAG: hypothetical protein JKX97_04595, partial [Candidatus Lindowbacteria bacterium]|nr:hypothetical protein [Candidatus Lindowbacteria bacterium]
MSDANTSEKDKRFSLDLAGTQVMLAINTKSVEDSTELLRSILAECKNRGLNEIDEMKVLDLIERPTGMAVMIGEFKGKSKPADSADSGDPGEKSESESKVTQEPTEPAVRILVVVSNNSMKVEMRFLVPAEGAEPIIE